MQYEFTSDMRQIYCPQDPFESKLVFDILDERLRMTVPFFVERDRDSCDEFRNGGWFAWPFNLRGLARMNEDPFILIIEVGLLVEYQPGDDPVTRWNETLGNPTDPADLLYVLGLVYPGRFDVIDPLRILNYLSVLGGKRAKGNKERELS